MSNEFTTSVQLEFDEGSATVAYHLPVGQWTWPAGAPIPQAGERFTTMVLKPQFPREWLEPRMFEVVRRSFWLHHDIETGELREVGTKLWLKDLGPMMTDRNGLGALGASDPIRRGR